MAELTAEQKAIYLADSGKCLYCRSVNITGIDSFDGEGQLIECEDCYARWIDLYKLVDVQIDTEPEEV